MASRTSDQVHTSGERQHVTAEDFPEYCTGATPRHYHMDSATPTLVCHTTGQESESQHDVGNCNLLASQQLESETSEALKKLNEAPSIDSLPSHAGSLQVQGQIESVGLLSAGSASLSQAQAMLHQSLDSGSLTAAVGELKQGQNQFDKQSNMSSSSRVTSTEINNILGSSIGTVTSNTSSEDNTKYQVLQGNQSRHCCASPPASSYLEMTAQTNIEQRLVDFDSISSHTHKKNGIPMNLPSNDLDRSLENNPYPCAGAGALPNNIPSQKHSMSVNEDWSLTLPKSITRSTQTDPSKDQDQDSYGGAASAESAVQTMSSGPASSLPSDDVLVRKLKRPIIQWLQRKLETNIGMAWQDLVDLHDWDYERITDFESFCSGKSPFCMLLAEPEFQMYRISDLKQDLEKLPRRDILYDLDEVLRRYYK